MHHVYRARYTATYRCMGRRPLSMTGKITVIANGDGELAMRKARRMVRKNGGWSDSDGTWKPGRVVVHEIEQLDAVNAPEE